MRTNLHWFAKISIIIKPTLLVFCSVLIAPSQCLTTLLLPLPMKSHASIFRRRHPSSDSFPAHSDANSSRARNPLALAALSVAGAFTTCFTYPETKTIPDTEFAVVSSTSRTGSERSGNSTHGSIRGSNHGSNRGIYGNSKATVQEREPGSVKFTMEEIYKATRNFSPSSKIGQGGFGIVYKGRLEDGTLVAIKRAKKGMYKKHLGVEFRSEIGILAQVEHLNLVKLYGYLENEGERIIVVEYVPNGTLREHLDGGHGNILDLAARLDISIDVAHAITNLHTYADHPIIHRDIKSSNILLTENFRAKVADFGFARLGAETDSGATHVSTQVKGTAGYLDPEYLKTSQLTDKSDVYSFGVLLVELVSGRRPIEAKRELKERITTRWAMKKFSDGDAISTLDPRLEHSDAIDVALEKILELALQCLAPRRESRPSMRRCAEILWCIRRDYRKMSGSDIYSLSSNSQRTFSVIEE